VRRPARAAFNCVAVVRWRRMRDRQNADDFPKGVDVLAKLGDGVEGRTVQRLSFKDREPDLHLVEPRGVSA
jgi:hypothetical protein